jgi:isoleucyl-tRNA synthetase
MKRYPEPNQNLDFAALERDILKFWQDEEIFKKSVEIRNFNEEESEDNVSPVTEPCALKDHTSCRHKDDFKTEKSEFVFYDGPPFANGLPHYGHLLTGFIKDIFARYQTMHGKKVERRFGWDTHGLPVEMETEKELTAKENRNISGQIAIQEYGIEKFNDACRASVMKYADDWENYVTRQGRFVDFQNSYKTMDINYMESVIWAFKQLHEKGLLYEDFRVVPYSWACQTPLSNFETKMDNAYRQKASKAVTVKFELDLSKGRLIEKNTKPDKNTIVTSLERSLSNELKNKFNTNKISLIAWTTTPWTLPSNLGLAVGKKIDYAVLKRKGHPEQGEGSHDVGQDPSASLQDDSEYLILANELVEKFTKDFGEVEKIDIVKGEELIGYNYKPIFPYFKPENCHKIKDECGDEYAFRILHGDFVTTDAGTGIVHLAPGFGEDDQLLCKSHGIPTLCPVDEAGKFNSDIFDLPELSLKGRQVFDTNDDIIKYLKGTGAWIKTEQYLHDYPHCWRTDTPLIYRAVSSWYVKVTDFKDRMVELNQGINWIPNHIKDGQFGKWLEGARDWSITRNRFWGCPVPVWKSESGKIRVFGSVAELEKVSGKKVDNLHRPFIDEITFEENGETFKRVTDVLDCWFESGSMPYAQVHYPFENKEWFEQNFPADFITEYVAQTRGWFYTLMVLSTALFDKAPFKNVICHGTILDENAQKLSKRLRNYADPLEIFSTFGSDALRFYMISQPVMRGQELKIDKEGKAVRDTLRLSIKPLINAFNFFCLYANSDGVTANLIEYKKDLKNTLDLYILSKLKASVGKIDNAMKNYDTVTACEEFNQFFEALNNWYIRRNRQRFWKSVEAGKIDQDKQDAYDTLYTVLITMCEAAAPLLPFTTEFVWKGLKGN